MKFEQIIKSVFILVIIEIIVLSFTIISGLEYGFKLWNWIVIGVSSGGYILFTIVIVLKENKGKTKVSKEELIVNDYYKEQAQLILNVLDNYLAKHHKVANDLKLYWPLYKGVLKRVASGKKLNGSDYGIVEMLKFWQEQNYEDPYLLNIYDVLKNNII